MQAEAIATRPIEIRSTPSFLREYRRYDRMLGALQSSMLDAAELQPGQVVIDVGSGAGTTALEAARRVGANGSVLGVDADPRAVCVANDRARQAGLSRLRVVCADAEHHAFEAKHAHAVVSRFGTLHFARPLRAFDNLRRALRPDGRLCFLCAREPSANAWYQVPAAIIARTLQHVGPRGLEPSDSGPFALADAAKLRWMLAEAGFRAVHLTAIDQALHVGDDLDDALEFLFETDARQLVNRLDDAKLAELTVALREGLAPFCGERGVRMPASIWLVQGRA